MNRSNETANIEWWERHYWISHHSAVAYARCDKCGAHAFGGDLNAKCTGREVGDVRNG